MINYKSGVYKGLPYSVRFNKDTRLFCGCFFDPHMYEFEVKKLEDFIWFMDHTIETNNFIKANYPTRMKNRFQSPLSIREFLS